MNHKDWLDNEYKQWVEALEASTVENFALNPAVRRMIGAENWYGDAMISFEQRERFDAVLSLGGDAEFAYKVLTRSIFYAQKILAQNPKHICEIGGGVGQLYAALKILGYEGKYYIYDLPPVQDFQRKYLNEVTRVTYLETPLDYGDFDFCVSLYALGEFDDELKDWYVQNVVKQCEHGLVVFNPHSGASSEINWPCKIEDEYPLTSPGNKLLTW